MSTPGNDSDNVAPENVASNPPQAIVSAPSGSIATKLWWLTIACIIIAVVMTTLSLRTPGTQITIRFPDGHGLAVGDAVRYRGVDVGTVDELGLSADLGSVVASVQLNNGNDRLAVEGSQFWVERPRLSVGQLGGLDTVIGAKYIGVLPGDPSGIRRLSFEGVSTPRTLSGRQWREISIQFPSGEGLEVGNPVRFRGIDVGEVTSVQLGEAAKNVVVRVQLVGSAGRLATAGTQFWIERPRLDLTEVRGLDTLIGGRNIAMQPGDPAAAEQDFFEGLAAAPPLPRKSGDLEIELDRADRLGLVRGAPVAYRGLEIGRVADVGLASDGASVKIRVIIEADYAALVRDNSKWWATSGMEVDAGIKGLKISVDSLSSWIRGGITVATPNSPGKPVASGHRFMLEAAPQKDWLNWKPRIAVGDSDKPPSGLPLPRAVRVVASWRNSMLGLYKQQSVQTWAVALSDGSVFVPSTFVDEVLESEADAKIELAGTQFPFKPSPRSGSLKSIRIVLPRPVETVTFPAEATSQDFESDALFLVINPELAQPLALDQTRLAQESEIGLRIAPGVTLAPELQGSPVVNSTTGKLYGQLTRGKKNWYVTKIK